MHSACSLASMAPLNPPAEWLMLSHFTDEGAQRQVFIYSRSHSCKCGHEIQAQLCLPALSGSPLAHRTPSSLQEYGSHGACVCVVGTGSHGVRRAYTGVVR